jgi:hypothetical protein
MAAQYQAAAQQALLQIQAQGLQLYNSVITDFDLAPLQKVVKAGGNVDDIYALITNKTLSKYVFWVVVVTAATAISGRRYSGGRSGIYIILATLLSVFFAPTLFPLLTGNPITWIQNDSQVITTVAITLVTLLGGRFITGLLPFRLVASFFLAAGASNVIAAGWKVGGTAFKSTSGAFIVAALDAAARPFATAIEAYLVDGAAPRLDIPRTSIFGAIVYGLLILNTANEKLAQVATFGLLAIAFLFANLGAPINFFWLADLILGGRSTSVQVKVEGVKQAIKDESQNGNNTPQKAASPNKKKQ